MTRPRAAAAATLILLTCTVSPAHALEPVEPPDAADVSVKFVTLYGRGCPAGSVAVALTPDTTGLRLDLTYGAATAEQRTMSCQMSLQVDAPEGYTYAVTAVDYAGEARLTTAESGWFQSQFFFTGASVRPPLWTVDIPTVGGWTPWRSNQEIAPGTEVYQPCDTRPTLNVSSRWRISTTGTSIAAKSFVDLWSEVGSSQLYHLTWARCPQA